MKKLKLITVLFFSFLSSYSGYGQYYQPIKNFDYSILEGKTLYLPSFNILNRKFKSLINKGEYEKINALNRKVDYHNSLWRDAMSESSYDATKYEFTDKTEKQFRKEKNKNVLLLYFLIDRYDNFYAMLVVTSPKWRVVARTVINDLDITQKGDLRLMFNMLNESLNNAMEFTSDGKYNKKMAQSKFKQQLVNFHEKMDKMTFLIPRSTHKNPKKAKQRNQDLKTALGSWKLSEYKITSEAQINKLRIEKDKNSFYWRSFPIYTKNPLITYRMNLIFTTESDDVVFGFLGTKRLKPSTIESLQKKLNDKVKKYKEQLAK